MLRTSNADADSDEPTTPAMPQHNAPQTSHNEQPHPKHNCHNPPELLLEENSWWFAFYRYLYLGFIATINIPFWTMAIYVWFYIVLLNTATSAWFKTLLLVYLVYTWLDPTPANGGYSSTWWTNERLERFRHIWFLKHFKRYFPTRLIQTASLKPQDGPYIFLYHPHGVIGVGACTALICNASNFDTIFPGLPRKTATLNACFLTPLYREFLLALGVVSANKTTLKHVLTQRQESIILLPGGATEALYAQPGTFQVYLRRRKGFVKLALETGAKLVPVLGFGETDAFHVLMIQDKTSLAARFQNVLCKALSFSLPIVTSPFPRPRPIHVVVGKPVDVAAMLSSSSSLTKEENTPEGRQQQPNGNNGRGAARSSPSEVEACHQWYIQALTDLYEEEKAKYGHEHIPLQIH